MQHRFAYPIVIALALSASPRAETSVPPVRHTGGDVDILVDGVPQARFAHDGRWYIEAIKGREYAIRLRNPYGVRVAVALSVDGLNTIDARQTTAREARKWVLDPHETVVISGWQTSRTDARRFEFTTEERSYGHALGKTANLGVISAVFFAERVPDVTLEAHDTAKQDTRGRAPSPPASARPAESPAAGAARKADEEYAATGMGRRTNHAVTEVSLDLQERPIQTVNIRYEFRPQLVRLGILPGAPTTDALQRRERARGFDPGFCPEPPRQR